MGLLEKIKEKAKENKQTIVLPEGNEIRTIKAASIAQSEGIANVILIGNENDIKEKAKLESADLSGVQIIDHINSEEFDTYVNEFYEIRKNKGITLEKARDTLKDEVYFGTMMLKNKKADGLVSGAVHSTGDILRPALQIIKTSKDEKIVSSFFVMEVPNCEYGEDGVFFFADCGVNIDPSAEELAHIAVSTSKSAKALAGIEPKVAMLSFSTLGSAKSESTEKVIEATRIAKSLVPSDVKIEGEFQLDAAIDKEIAKIKSPNSSVAGNANILVFPNLDAGNIGYKLTQRLAKAEATGPICQGFAAPINDLSRGCSVEDIVNTVAITAVQSINKNL